MLDSWLPVGFTLPDQSTICLTLHGGTDWQICLAHGDMRCLIVNESLSQRWREKGLIEPGFLSPFNYGNSVFVSLSSPLGQTLTPVEKFNSRHDFSEILAFVESLKATREIDPDSSLHDGIYIERLTRILPTYSLSARINDDVLLGARLSGGVPVSVKSVRRLKTLVPWISAEQLSEIVERAGINDAQVMLPTQFAVSDEKLRSPLKKACKRFELPGRPELEAFFNEHIIDIIENKERYAALGIDFPSAIILHGPPGCGKTFAVERLIEHLGWPNFQIDSSSVGSPFIHETSRKVAGVFDKSIQNSPSVLVIDEMEAFLSDRQTGANSQNYHVEEVAEFLRRIPEAVNNHVLIFAMTNRLEMIDPAILRRGRFDHVIKVDFATEAEIISLLKKQLSEIPSEGIIDYSTLAKKLYERPLSDVAFVVREAARIAARSGRNSINSQILDSALEKETEKTTDSANPKKIGFITAKNATAKVNYRRE